MGHWRAEHLFTLQQSRELYRMYQDHQDHIAAGDREIEQTLRAFTPRVDPTERPLPPDQKTRTRKRRGPTAPTGATTPPSACWDLRTDAYKLFGVDVTQMPGLETMVRRLFSEVGRDLSKWPTPAHFASWLALCPDNDISGGRVLWTGLRKVDNRAGQLFRLAAYSLHRSPTPLGDYLRRMKAKLGPAAATTATAHKIAIIFYTLITNQVEYDASMWATRDAQRHRRLEATLHRQAKRLGYQLVPINEKPAA